MGRKDFFMNIKKIMLSLIAGAVGAVVLSISAMAATIEVETAEDFYNAVKDAQPGDVINLNASVTYTGWDSIWNKDGITINGNGNTISVNEPGVDSNINGGGMFLKASNLTINDLTVILPEHSAEMPRLATMKSGTLNNVTVTGGTFAVSIVGEGPIEINNCTFEDLAGWAIETEGKSTNAVLTIENSAFDDNAVILRGNNNTFTGNTITDAGEGVNVLGEAVISGNDFGNSTLGIDSGVEVTITENVINNVMFTTWLGENGYDEVTVTNNTLSEEAVAEFKETVNESIVSVDPVAAIGSKNYYSLEKALAALEEGDTLMLATGEYEGFDILVDDVTITGMTDDTVITITAVPGNAFIGINAEGVSIEDLTFVVSEDYTQTGNYLDGFDAVIGYWSKNFDAGSRVTTGYDVTGCTFINKSTTMGVAMFNFSSFEITGNAFENFNVGIHTMSDGAAMGDVVISGNTFTKVNEPVNVYWGQNGGEDDSIEITNNDFVSAKDSDEIKITVHDYASTETGTAGIDAIDLSGNTYSEATEVVLVDAATDVSEDAKEDLENAKNAVLDTKYAAVARIGEDKYFTTLEVALAAAQKDDVIDLLGNTLEITSINTTKNMHTKNLTFQNGTMDFTNAVASNSLFDMTANQTIKFKDMTLLIKDREEGSAMCYWMDLRAATAVAYFENCYIDFDAVQYSYISANGDGKVFFKNCIIEAEQTNFVYRAGATFENCTFDGYAGLSEGERAGNVILWAAVPCTIKNSTINTRQLGSITANGTIAIVENSYVYAEKVCHYYATSDEKYTAGLVTVDATSTLEAVELDMGMINDASEGKITSEASKVYIQYKKTDLDEKGEDNLEDADTYEIVLAGANNNAATEIINELASADITFKFVGTPVLGGAMDYTVTGAKGVTVTQLGDSDRFMFNYNGVDKYEETGAAIVIGTITVSGYGTYYLGTDATATTNAVYATEIKDNIVDGFEAAGDLVVNVDMIEEDGMVGEIDGTEITVPTRELKINIDFPNEATTDNAVAYQQMKVVVSGGDLEEALVIKLGDTAEITDLAKFVAKTSKDKAVSAVASDDAYDITITDLLTLNIAYNVEVSGAGYRTARYTVTMTEDKTLNFWNNVKDNETVIEEGKKTAKVTFLAGDIVKDNDINIYDLSAVVSYFGEEGLGVDKYPEYAKYDLNRDGKIDSKDVAYVLVSWGN